MFVQRAASVSRPEKVLVVLELKDPENYSERRHALILMLENGHCVAMGGPSPIITYYPNWAGIEFFTNVKLDDYDANDPSEYEIPQEWDTGSTPMGPMG